MINSKTFEKNICSQYIYITVYFLDNTKGDVLPDWLD